MRTTARVAVVAVVAALPLLAASPASAHWVHVDTPSGQSTCQFLGGPGNPGHAGHSHGHPAAIAHSGSEVAAFGGPC